MNTACSIYEYVRESISGCEDYQICRQGERALTRNELLGHIDAAAAFFAARMGIGAGDVVAIDMESTIDQLVAFLALNRLGVITLMINAQTPPSRVCELAAFAGARQILLSRPVEGVSGEVFAESTYAAYRGQVGPAETCDGSRDAVYFCSGGTTGKSQVIRIPHLAVNAVMEGARAARLFDDLEPGEGAFVACMPFYHSYGLIHACLTMIVQRLRAIVLPRFDAGAYIAEMKRDRIVAMQGVPLFFKKLIDHADWRGGHLASVRVVGCGGDSVDRTIERDVNDSIRVYAPSVVRSPGYGLTECCGVVTYHDCFPWRERSIGRPIAGVRVEIWDESNQRVCPGVVGELVVSGPTCMSGYLTADRRPDAGIFTDAEGGRWVKTGDLAIQDEDGYFFFKGRRKRLIIIAGYNVFPGDIEEAVYKLAGVKEVCAVMGYQDGRRIIRLYIVKGEDVVDEEILRADVRRVCAEKVSRFAVPRDIRFVEALPRTSVNKVDFMRLTQNSPKANVWPFGRLND